MEQKNTQKKNNLKKLLVAFIIILVIVLVIAIPVSLLSSNKPSNNNKNKLNGPKDVKDYPCTKKGEICSYQEMYKGVEVNVEVSKGETYTFRMIANDKFTMTLMLEENIEEDVEWEEEGINFKGPQTALFKVNQKVANWNNINNLKKYSYTDKGKLDSEQLCATGEHNEFECPKDEFDKRGYNSLNIEDGKVKFIYNMPPEKDPEPGFELITEGTLQGTAKARLITLEEYEEFINDDGVAKWLMEGLDKNEGYWTMTSASKLTTGYNQAAVAIVNKAGKIRTENVPVARGNEYYKVGIRPVIKIDKK